MSVTVTPNHAPVAVDDAATTVRDATVTISVTQNDTDADPVDNGAILVAGHTDAAHGTVTCLSTTCDYTPAARFVGTDGFDYTVSDGELSDVGHVSLNVTRPCASAPGACIDNQVIQLGINREGDLNVDGGAPSVTGVTGVGLRYLPTNSDATSPGCYCEGGGAADVTSGITGYANVFEDGVQHLSLVSFSSTGDTATSVVDVTNNSGAAVLRVTHDYHPSAVPEPLRGDGDAPEHERGARWRRATAGSWTGTSSPRLQGVRHVGAPPARRTSCSRATTASRRRTRSVASRSLFTGDAVDSGPADTAPCSTSGSTTSRPVRR